MKLEEFVDVDRSSVEKCNLSISKIWVKGSLNPIES